MREHALGKHTFIGVFEAAITYLPAYGARGPQRMPQATSPMPRAIIPEHCNHVLARIRRSACCGKTVARWSSVKFVLVRASNAILASANDATPRSR